MTTSPAGEAQITFDLSESVTTFRARADAFFDVGALGHGESLLQATRPFSVEPRLPPELTAGDLVEVPIAVTNGTATHADVNVSLGVTGGFLASRDAVPLAIGKGRRERAFVTLAVMKGRGVFPVTVRASAGLCGDEVTRSITVVPGRFPRVLDASSRLDPDGAAVHVIRLPATIERGHARLVAFERAEGGFEWLGGDPGYPALTAWGLLALAQTARVFAVDPALVLRPPARLANLPPREARSAALACSATRWLPRKRRKGRNAAVTLERRFRRRRRRRWRGRSIDRVSPGHHKLRYERELRGSQEWCVPRGWRGWQTPCLW